MYLGRGVGARVLPLIQLVPALHQFDDHGVAEVDQLEARHVGAAVHEALQIDVFETLEGKQADKAGHGLSGCKEETLEPGDNHSWPTPTSQQTSDLYFLT